MTRVRVLSAFRDKEHFSVLFAAGDVVEFESGRAAHIVALGLGEEVSPAPSAEDNSICPDEPLCAPVPSVISAAEETSATPKKKRQRATKPLCS